MFHEKLQIKVMEIGMTNKEFAKLAGIKKNHLNDLLGGEIPSNFTIGRLSKALGLDQEEIRSWIPSENKIVKPYSQKIVLANFKDKPKSPLKAKGRFCVRCYFMEKIYIYDTVEMAHYTGYRQQSLGKGTGQKVSDILKAPLCKKCHNYFDIETEYKSVDKSEEFLFYISLFLAQEFESGNIVAK